MSIDSFVELTGNYPHTDSKRKHKKAFRLQAGANRELQVDKAYFDRRWKFYNRVREEAHELYYIINKHLSDTQLVWIMNNYCSANVYWERCIGYRLFNPIDSTVYANPKIPPCLWYFWRFWRRLKYVRINTYSGKIHRRKNRMLHETNRRTAKSALVKKRPTSSKRSTKQKEVLDKI